MKAMVYLYTIISVFPAVVLFWRKELLDYDGYKEMRSFTHRWKAFPAQLWTQTSSYIRLVSLYKASQRRPTTIV